MSGAWGTAGPALRASGTGALAGGLGAAVFRPFVAFTAAMVALALVSALPVVTPDSPTWGPGRRRRGARAAMVALAVGCGAMLLVTSPLDQVAAVGLGLAAFVFARRVPVAARSTP